MAKCILRFCAFLNFKYLNVFLIKFYLTSDYPFSKENNRSSSVVKLIYYLSTPHDLRTTFNDEFIAYI